MTYSFLKLAHTLGFVAWFVGLLGTTAAQVAARKAPTRDGRLAAWSVVKRLSPFEVVGLVVTPLAGLALAVSGGWFKQGFVHAKLLFVVVAIAFNLVVIAKRRAIGARLEADAADAPEQMKRLAMFHGIATLMLPLAILAVFLMR